MWYTRHCITAKSIEANWRSAMRRMRRRISAWAAGLSWRRRRRWPKASVSRVWLLNSYWSRRTGSEDCRTANGRCSSERPLWAAGGLSLPIRGLSRLMDVSSTIIDPILFIQIVWTFSIVLCYYTDKKPKLKGSGAKSDEKLTSRWLKYAQFLIYDYAQGSSSYFLKGHGHENALNKPPGTVCLYMASSRPPIPILSDLFLYVNLVATSTKKYSSLWISKFGAFFILYCSFMTVVFFFLYFGLFVVVYCIASLIWKETRSYAMNDIWKFSCCG